MLVHQPKFILVFAPDFRGRHVWLHLNGVSHPLESAHPADRRFRTAPLVVPFDFTFRCNPAAFHDHPDLSHANGNSLLIRWIASRAISGSGLSSTPGRRISMSLATATTPATRFASASAWYFCMKLRTNPASVTTPLLTVTAMSVASMSGSHRSSPSTSRLMSLSDRMLDTPFL